MTTFGNFCENFSKLGINPTLPSVDFEKPLEEVLTKKYEWIDEIWHSLSQTISHSTDITLRQISLLPSFAFAFPSCEMFFKHISFFNHSTQASINEFLTLQLKNQSASPNLIEHLVKNQFTFSLENLSLLCEDQKNSHLSFRFPPLTELNHETYVKYFQKEIHINFAIHQLNQPYLENKQNINCLPYQFENLSKIIHSLDLDQEKDTALLQMILDLYGGTPGFHDFYYLNFTLHELFTKNFSDEEIHNHLLNTAPIPPNLNMEETNEYLLRKAIFEKKYHTVLHFSKNGWLASLPIDKQKFFFKAAFNHSSENIAIELFSCISVKEDYLFYWIKRCKQKNWNKATRAFIKAIHSNVLSGKLDKSKLIDLLTTAIDFPEIVYFKIMVESDFLANLSSLEKEKIFLLCLKNNFKACSIYLNYDSLPDSSLCKATLLRILSQNSQTNDLVQLMKKIYLDCTTKQSSEDIYEILNILIKENEQDLIKIGYNHKWLHLLSPAQKQNIFVSAFNQPLATIACLLFDLGIIPSYHFMAKCNLIDLALKKNWLELAARLFYNPKTKTVNSIPKKIKELIRINHLPFLKVIANQSIENEEDYLIHLEAAIDLKNITYANLLIDQKKLKSLPNDLLIKALTWAIDEEYEQFLHKLIVFAGTINFIIINDQGTPETLFTRAIRLKKFSLYTFFMMQEAYAEEIPHFHRLCWLGEGRKVSAELKKDPTLADSKDFEDNSPLIYAIHHNKKNIFNLLLKFVDVNAKNIADSTPLHYAFMYQRTGMIKALLKKQASIHWENKEGNPPYITNYYYYLLENLRLFLSLGADFKKITPQAAFEIYRRNIHDEFLDFFKENSDLDESSINKIKIAVSEIQLAHAWGISGKQQTDLITYNLEGNSRLSTSKHFKIYLTNYFCQPQNRLMLEKHGIDLYEKFIKAIKSMDKNLKLNPATILANIKSNQPVILFSGWPGHSITVIFYGETLAITNRGEQHGHYGTQFYKYNSEKLTKEAIEKIQHVNKEFVLSTLFQELECEFLNGFFQKLQSVGNCSHITAKCIPRTLLYLLFKEVQPENAYDNALKFQKSWIRYYLEFFFKSYLKQCNKADINVSLVEKILIKAKTKKLSLPNPLNQVTQNTQ